MEQRHDLPCPGIKPGDIRPFVAVARKTSKAKIPCFGLTQVMFGDDVIDLEGKIEIVPGGVNAGPSTS